MVHYDPNVNQTLAWEHDATGNRTKQTKGSTVTTYVYDANDRLTTETTDTTVTTYTYSGTRLTQKSVKAGSAAATNTPYTYNVQGRISSVSGTAYKYDTEGILVSRGTTTFLNGKLNPTGYSQVFVEATGSTKKAFTYGHDLISQHSGSTLLTMLYDGLGSVRGVLNSNGAIDGNVAFCYDAFGNTIGTAPSATDYRYAGERLDTTTGWYYLRQRYYDPKIGRFNRLDPFWGNASDPQSLHKYTYCHGDPVNHVDPSGEFLAVSLSGMAISMGRHFQNAVVTFSARKYATNIVISSALGSVMGMVDAYSARGSTFEDIIMGGLYGAIGGFVTGATAPFIHPVAILAIGLPLSGVGVVDAYANGNTEQAFFRLIAGPVATILSHYGLSLQSVRTKILGTVYRLLCHDGPSNPLHPYIIADPNLKIGMRGSTQTGQVSNPNKTPGPWNQEDFDLDIFIVSDKLSIQFGRKQLIKLPEVREALVHDHPEFFSGLRPGGKGVSLKIFSENEAATKGGIIFYEGGKR